MAYLPPGILLGPSKKGILREIEMIAQLPHN